MYADPGTPDVRGGRRYAHRPHTAHDADRVAVMEYGRITEPGGHAGLVAPGGTYAALWATWHGDAPSDSAARRNLG
ncbi:hypothetical protein [Streptomyces fumanus]|uniref:hypothetical protein n=1 Tax=Streptomyces fumanus TaxID=67302 RepID=UPI003407E6A6